MQKYDHDDAKREIRHNSDEAKIHRHCAEGHAVYETKA